MSTATIRKIVTVVDETAKRKIVFQFQGNAFSVLLALDVFNVSAKTAQLGRDGHLRPLAARTAGHDRDRSPTD